MTTSRLGWGILGTGNIAHVFAKALPKSKAGHLVAVGSRQQAAADKFAQEFGPVTAHGSYDALLADPAVQAVYISVPHPQHAEWCIKAAKAKKHILCEKPLTLNYAEAMVVAEAARENGVFLMEAFMYRCHPQTAKLVELIRDGTIGEVSLIQATFSFSAGFNPDSRLYNNALGGGGILDVGCYTMSIARLVAGAALGKPFADPIMTPGWPPKLYVLGAAQLHPETSVDVYATATVAFPAGIVAQLVTGVGLNAGASLQVFGSKGTLSIDQPFVPTKEGGEAKIMLTFPGKEPEAVTTQTDTPLYALEADAVADALAQGKLESTFMPVADTLGNMIALDAWRDSVKMVYDSEKPSAAFSTIHRQPLTKRADAVMPYSQVPGVQLPVSRLILGCDNQLSMPFATAIFDDYFERGGNAFDTAYHYGGGLQERLLGRWIQQRELRSQVVVLAKGAHTPLCTPEFLDQQFRESLERLKTDYADIYLMHRDNLDVPVGEFVDILNEHHKAGRIRAFGGSNWSLPRLKQAQAYAKRKGLQGFTCVSNNLSLARMVDPVWTGCISASEPDFKKWLAKNQIPLLAWSSQARGFFTERAHPDKREDEELVRCWYSEDNFQRRERAVELAKKKGVQPINIALAYVLNQRFPSFALIGPRHISETASTFAGLTVELTPKEVRWLNLGIDSINAGQFAPWPELGNLVKLGSLMPDHLPPFQARLTRIYGEEIARSLAPRLLTLAQSYQGRISAQPAGWDQGSALLITYADSLLGNAAPLQELHAFLRRRVQQRFNFVHILPFYPYTSDDGFSVVDYREVRPDLGTWRDLEKFGADYRLVYDGVINHISASSKYVQEYLQGNPAYRDFCISLPPDTDTSAVLRTRNLPLLHDYPAHDGTRWLWTTFSRDQVDLNFSNPEVLLEITDVLLEYAAHGAAMIRLDAIPYLWKKLGTSCAHLPETHEIIKLFRDVFDVAAPHVFLLTETNVPHHENLSYMGDHGDEAQMIYNFSLAPLIVWSFYKGNAEVLTKWAGQIEFVSPRATYLNITATHDGIGMRPTEGILSEDERKELVQLSFDRQGDMTGKRNADGSVAPYELNLSYFDAINDPLHPQPADVEVQKFLTSQAIPIAMMGIPGIYVHSLLGSRNALDDVRKTGRARSINRAQLPLAELESALDDSSSVRAQVFHGILRLLELRSRESAFHPDARQEVLSIHAAVFALRRTNLETGHVIFALHNVSNERVTVTLPRSGVALLDLLTHENIDPAQEQIPLASFQIRWLRVKSS